MKKVDLVWIATRRKAPLAMTEKKLCINKILGIAVGAVDFHRLQRILGFLMNFACCEKKHKGVTLAETCGLF